MAFDVNRAASHAQFMVGMAKYPGELPALDVVNRTGHMLTNLHKWEFLLGPSKPLDTRAKVTITNATTSSGTLTVQNSELAA